MDVDEADFDRIVAVNLKGVWLSLRAEVRAIVASGREGSIVNTSSVGGYRGSSGLGAYQATKHGVVGLTRTAAHDCGPFGIRVNVVAPGATETEMIRDWRARDPQAVDRRIGLIPLKRAAQPAEVADAAAWLISSMSGTINGALIPIDGGYSA
jgi:NAD(P)-dependent dehydrogenase (short-subunit alcohol dehydrogenase family)